MKKLLCLVLALITLLSTCAFASSFNVEVETAIYFYEQGNYKKAEQLFLEQGNNNNLIACAYLANIYLNNLTNKSNAASLYYTWSTKTNNLMDEMYARSVALREEENYETIVAILEELALFNHPKALNDLAICYYKGTGVTKDLAYAYEYMSRAAALDHPTSLYNLGVFYENGYYVQKNLPAALECFEKAYELGYEKADAAAERVRKQIGPTPNPTPAAKCTTCKDSRVCYLCKGTKKSVGVTCIACEGTGKCPSCGIIITRKCKVCNDTRRCTACAGFGHIGDETCHACDGKRTCKYCR